MPEIGLTPKPKEYKLGHEVEYEGQRALVTRIDNMSSLFETRTQRFVINELFVELITDKGEIVFVTLDKTRLEAPLPAGVTIRGPEPYATEVAI